MKHNNRISQYFDQDEPSKFSDKQINEDNYLNSTGRTEQDSKRIKDCESFNCGPSFEVSSDN